MQYAKNEKNHIILSVNTHTKKHFIIFSKSLCVLWKDLCQTPFYFHGMIVHGEKQYFYTF